MGFSQMKLAYILERDRAIERGWLLPLIGPEEQSEWLRWQIIETWFKLTFENKKIYISPKYLMQSDQQPVMSLRNQELSLFCHLGSVLHGSKMDKW